MYATYNSNAPVIGCAEESRRLSLFTEKLRKNLDESNSKKHYDLTRHKLTLLGNQHAAPGHRCSLTGQNSDCQRYAATYRSQAYHLRERIRCREVDQREAGWR